METDTKPTKKSCSKCGETKDDTLFISKRSNICKVCRNNKIRENYNQPNEIDQMKLTTKLKNATVVKKRKMYVSS